MIVDNEFDTVASGLWVNLAIHISRRIRLAKREHATQQLGTWMAKQEKYNWPRRAVGPQTTTITCQRQSDPRS